MSTNGKHEWHTNMKARMNTNMRCKKGQALVELAVFGSIIIWLLGVLVSYGLRYNFQQQAQQLSFRRVLRVVQDINDEEIGSSSYLLFRENHIPDPGHPFAVGSASSVQASASAVRDYKMHETPDYREELAHMIVDIPANLTLPYATDTQDGVFPVLYTTAFRDMNNVSTAELYTQDYDCDEDGSIDGSRYDCVYGAENSGWWVRDDGEGACLSTLECTTDPATGIETCICPEGSASYNIRILDGAVGNIIEYQTVHTRCYQAFRAGIELPWYCDGVRPDPDLFNFGNTAVNPHDRQMGIQSDYTQTTTMNNSLGRVETHAGITTLDIFDWQIDTDRDFVFNDGVKAGGKNDGVDWGSARIRTRAFNTMIKNQLPPQPWSANW